MESHDFKPTITPIENLKTPADIDAFINYCVVKDTTVNALGLEFQNNENGKFEPVKFGYKNKNEYQVGYDAVERYTYNNPTLFTQIHKNRCDVISDVNNKVRNRDKQVELLEEYLPYKECKKIEGFSSDTTGNFDTVSGTFVVSSRAKRDTNIIQQRYLELDYPEYVTITSGDGATRGNDKIIKSVQQSIITNRDPEISAETNSMVTVDSRLSTFETPIRIFGVSSQIATLGLEQIQISQFRNKRESIMRAMSDQFITNIQRTAFYGSGGDKSISGLLNSHKTAGAPPVLDLPDPSKLNTRAELDVFIDKIFEYVNRYYLDKNFKGELILALPSKVMASLSGIVSDYIDLTKEEYIHRRLGRVKTLNGKMNASNSEISIAGLPCLDAEYPDNVYKVDRAMFYKKEAIEFPIIENFKLLQEDSRNIGGLLTNVYAFWAYADPIVLYPQYMLTFVLV